MGKSLSLNILERLTLGLALVAEQYGAPEAAAKMYGRVVLR
jgi:hypothetical protein